MTDVSRHPDRRGDGDGRVQRGMKGEVTLPGCLVVRRGTILHSQIFWPLIDVVAVVSEHLEDIADTEVNVQSKARGE